MKNKALSIVEMMMVMVIGTMLFGAVFGVFITGRNSWAKSEVYIDLQSKTRLAMDRMVKELSSSSPAKITLGSCAGNVCRTAGFLVPTAVGGSIYNSEGDIIWGAEGWEDLSYSYFVTYDNRLVRAAGEVQGACCLPGGVCEQKYGWKCTALGGTWQGPLIPCAPDPCSGGGGSEETFRIKPFFEYLFEPTLAYAQENVWVLAANIQEVTFENPIAPAAPTTILIAIKARRKSILGEDIEVILHSIVSPRN